MKKYYFDVVFNTGDHYKWLLAPVGTESGYEKYEYHEKNIPYHENAEDVVKRFEAVLKGFRDNVIGEEADIVKDVLDSVIAKDWTTGFTIHDYKGHGDIYIKYYIDDHEERTPYTFYPTEEQLAIIDNIKYKVGDDVDGYEGLNAQELNDAILNKLLMVYENWLCREYEEEIDRELS